MVRRVQLLSKSVLSICAVFSLIALTAGGLNGQSQAPAKPESALTRAVGSAYALEPFDLVRVSVYGQEDLETEQRISDKGTLSMPLLGEIEVGGLNVPDAAKKIEQAFIDREFIRSPVVTISVMEFAPKVVTVLGQVEEPGPVTIPPGRNGIPLQVAIAGAGGFTGTAKISEVRVTRAGKRASGDESNFIVVNADKILESLDNAEDTDPVTVFPDDIVFVPRRVF
jgi:protein involved in polysaccharide export with SLBB domain